jgi:hypothetical protein
MVASFLQVQRPAAPCAGSSLDVHTDTEEQQGPALLTRRLALGCHRRVRCPRESGREAGELPHDREPVVLGDQQVEFRALLISRVIHSRAASCSDLPALIPYEPES